MNENSNEYRILALGDLHFDGSAYHVREPADEVQKRGRLRNFAMWNGPSQDLIADAAGHLDDSFPWVIQCGDISQGDGDTVELQTAMISDSLTYLKRAFPEKKVLPVIGNHDLRLLDSYPRWNEYDENGDCTMSAGGEYRPILKTVLPFIAREAGLPAVPHSADYVMKRGRDLYIFVDPFRPGGATEFIRRALAETPDSRYVFVVSHLALFPCEPAKKWAAWILPDCRELAEMLAPRRAILVSAHTHYLHMIRYRHPKGILTQLVLSSMSTNWKKTPLQMTTADYAAFARSMFPFLEVRPRDVFAPENYLEHRTWRCFNDGKPSSATGYAVLNIGDDAVTADIYDGGRSPAFTLDLA